MTVRRLLVLLALTAAPTASSTAAAAADAQVISAAGTVSAPVPAFTAAGGAEVAWTDLALRGLATARLDPGTSAFSPPALVLAGTGYEQFPVYALDDRGLLVAAAERAHKPYSRIRGSMERPDGTFTSAVTLSGSGHTARDAALAMAPDGTTIAAWRFYDGHRWQAQYALRRPGQPFGPPVTLTAGEGDRPGQESTPEVAIDAQGDCIAVWRSGNQLWIASGTVAAGLGTPRSLDPDDVGGYKSFLVAAGGDRVTVVWVDDQTPSGATMAISAMIVPPGGPYAGATHLPLPSGATASGPKALAMTDSGAALVAVAADDGMLAFEAPAGRTAFGAPQRIGDATIVQAPSLAVDDAGDAVLAYVAQAPAAILVARRTPDGVWATPSPISPPQGRASDPHMALAPDGRALASWVQAAAGSGRSTLDAEILRP